jgi:hypothetical protein
MSPTCDGFGEWLLDWGEWWYNEQVISGVQNLGRRNSGVQ